MKKAVEEGKVRSIGLSNFEDRIDILKICKIKPAVVQVECHPFWSQDDLRKKVEKYGTIIESWFPIGHGDKRLIDHEIFTRLSKKYNKTNLQVILRWNIQKGNVVFPKSTNPKHIKENSEIFDFCLSKEEMDEINKMGNTKRFYNFNVEQQEEMYMKYMLND